MRVIGRNSTLSDSTSGTVVNNNMSNDKQKGFVFWLPITVSLVVIMGFVFPWINTLVTTANEIPQLKLDVKEIKERNIIRDEKFSKLQEDVAVMKSDISWVRRFLDPNGK